MSLNEAIKHAEEVAKQNEDDAIVYSNCKNHKKNLYEIGLAENIEKKCRKCAEEHRQIAEWLKELKQLRKQTRWIPVSERLPEDGIYLVTVERTTGVQRIETKSFAKDLHRVDDFDFPEHKCGWYDYDSEYGYWEDTNVIAWMSLPEPYKAESEG